MISAKTKRRLAQLESPHQHTPFGANDSWGYLRAEDYEKLQETVALRTAKKLLEKAREFAVRRAMDEAPDDPTQLLEEELVALGMSYGARENVPPSVDEAL